MTTVATSGCFDILHAGHVDFLTRCRLLGDELVVYLNSDESVRRLKGRTRPVNTLELRLTVLNGLRAIDRIVICHASNPCAHLRQDKPDIFCKGSEYADKGIPEEEVVEEYGGTMMFLNRTVELTTTSIIERIQV